MSNVNNPHGLRPLMRCLNGGAPQLEQYTKPAGYAYAIFKWDPVTLLVTGYLGAAAHDITPGTTYLLGVALEWAPASQLSNHNIMVSPDAIFEIQDDGSSDGTNSGFQEPADRGQNANLVLTTAGGGVTRDNSGAQLAYSSHATTSTLDLKTFKLLNEPDNASGANARIEVRINKHLLSAGVAGV